MSPGDLRLSFQISQNMSNSRGFIWALLGPFIWVPGPGPFWAHSFGPGPNGLIWAHCSILRFCHARGQNKRWGAVRHVIVSGISIRVYSVLTNIVHMSKNNRKLKKMFEHVDKSRKSIFFGKQNDFRRGCPKMCFREFGPIPDRFRPKIDYSDAG